MKSSGPLASRRASIPPSDAIPRPLAEAAGGPIGACGLTPRVKGSGTVAGIVGG